MGVYRQIKKDIHQGVFFYLGEGGWTNPHGFVQLALPAQDAQGAVPREVRDESVVINATDEQSLTLRRAVNLHRTISSERVCR